MMQPTRKGMKMEKQANERLKAEIGRLVHGDFHAVHGWDTPLVNKLTKIFRSELKKRENELRSKHITDLARAVGILEGLGHPDVLLERHYQEAVSRLNQKGPSNAK